MTDFNKRWRDNNKERRAQYARDGNARRLSADPYGFTVKRLFDNARARAKRFALPFDIDEDYIKSIWPADNKCPVLNTLFEIGTRSDRETSASIDRVLPNLGYVPGNVKIISFKANRIKNDACLEELEAVVSYLKPLLEDVPRS
jgi:hypothetical protein